MDSFRAVVAMKHFPNFGREYEVNEVVTHWKTGAGGSYFNQ